MRKVTAGFFHSVDGVIEAPNLWQGDAFDNELGALLGEVMGKTDTVIMGRVGYQDCVGYWPNAAIGLVRNAGEQWLASPPGPAKPGQEAMARQITDWLCFGIAPELNAPAAAAQTDNGTR